MVTALPDVLEPLAPAEAPDGATDVEPSDRAASEPRLFARIAVPYDGSALSRAALEPAATLAHACGASVTLINAVEPARVPGVAEPLALSMGDTDARMILQEAAQRFSSEGVAVAELLVLPRPGDPPSAPPAILTALRTIGADLLVMTTHGRTGAPRVVLGSVADAVVRHAHVPVLLISRMAAPTAATWPEAEGGGLPRTVLVALCGDSLSEAALDPAARLALAIDGGVELVRVVPDNRLVVGQGYGTGAMTRAAEDYLARQAEAVTAAYPRLRFVRTAALVADRGRVADTIGAHAPWCGARAIALATHGRSGLARLLLGSVTAGVVAAAAVPVLVVPPGAPPQSH